VEVTVSIPEGSGDLLGLFGNVLDESLLPDLVVEDPTGIVTQWQLRANRVWKVGGGNVMAPVRSWDWGVKLGATGSPGGVVVEEATFALVGPGLTAHRILAAATEGWVLGVRVQGTAGSEGSSKLGLSEDAPRLAIEEPPAGAILGASPVAVAGTVLGSGVAVDVNGVAASAEAGAFAADVPVAEGPNTLVVTGSNALGSATDAVEVVLDDTPPAVSIEVPPDGALTAQPTVRVSGLVTDANEIDSVTVNNSEVELVGHAFSTSVALAFGANPIRVEAADVAGNTGAAEIVVTRGEPPSLTIDQPQPGILVNFQRMPVVGMVEGDAPLTVTANETVAELEGGAYSVAVPLGEGTNTIFVRATNPFGEALRTVQVERDRTPPVLSLASPTDGEGFTTEAVVASGSVSDPAGVFDVSVGGKPVQLLDGSFSVPVPLALGSNALRFQATDGAGNITREAITVLRGEAPTVRIESPADGRRVAISPLPVEGSATGVSQVQVNEVVVPVVNRRFNASVPLVDGESNVVTAEASSAFGTVRDSVEVLFRKAPSLQITSPEDDAAIASDAVTVVGTVDEAAASLVVNGTAATVSPGDPPTFVAVVPLAEGVNRIAARAMDEQGDVGLATVQVLRDRTPPRVTIETPADGTTVSEPSLVVTGSVRDFAVENADVEGELRVQVDGILATVRNGRFSVSGVPLSEGANRIEAVASDPFGEQAVSSVEVSFDPPAAGSKLVKFAGDLQSGVVGQPLPEPLRVRLQDSEGEPLADTQLVARIAKGDGVLDPNGDEARALVTTTDAQGQASFVWALGTRAGAASDAVEITAPGFEVPPKRFHASAEAGPPADLHADSGDNQSGIPGEPLPRPFVVVATDVGHNRLPGIGVVFRVEAGDGHFEGDAIRTVVTDRNGRASARLTLGPEAGINAHVVRAAIAGDLESSVRFGASAHIPGDPTETAVRGVVLDNSDLPVPGTTLRIDGTALETTADAEGLFRIEGVPPGPYHLEVDGSTATREGRWVNLEFQRFALPGVENRLRRPIHLVAENPNGIDVDETEGGTLTLPEIPGFSLEVAPGSVTFPDGSRSGRITATIVHPDKVPMAPQFGQQPRFVVSIQPANARFDPPARITAPNVDGLEAGEVTELYSFDHELDRFVNIATATVSEDRSVVISDPGAGILKAGWHASSPPVTTGDARNTTIEIAVVVKPEWMLPVARPGEPQIVPFEETFEVEARQAGPLPGNFGWQTVDSSILALKGESAGPDVDRVTVESRAVGSASIVGRFRAASGAEDGDEAPISVATPEVVVVSWVDGSAIELPAGANPALVDNLGPISCAFTLRSWSEGDRGLVEGDADRRFANAWLLKNSPNGDPGREIDPTAVEAEGDFRLYNRFRIFFPPSSNGDRPAEALAGSKTLVGNSPPPCALASIGVMLGFADTSPELHPRNGERNLEGGMAFWQLAEGRIGFEGQKVDRTLNAPLGEDLPPVGAITPWIWTAVKFGPDGEFQGLGGCSEGADCSIFPTHSIFVDGERVGTIPQSDPEVFIQKTSDFQLLPSQVD